MKETCFGVIPLRQIKGGWQVFLVKHRKGGYWSFPKGHGNPGEEELEAAERELFEETGFHVSRLLPIQKLNEQYQFQRDGKNIDKMVTYFAAEVTGEFKPQKVEIEDGEWLFLGEAIDRITFQQSRHLCIQIRSLLQTL